MSMVSPETHYKALGKLALYRATLTDVLKADGTPSAIREYIKGALPTIVSALHDDTAGGGTLSYRRGVDAAHEELHDMLG